MHVSTPIIYKVISLYYMSLSYTNHKRMMYISITGIKITYFVFVGITVYVV